ncbi:MAG: HAMP domain-containing histidine kinase [Candidatus Krumholzibacteriota bacterium]|nr:HAMP domain-containing histidine kinase [Candidatus Krumholzibacteriota bacterium]
MKHELNIRTSRNLPFLLKVYFIAGTVLLVSAALLYNNSLMKRMTAQAESTASLFSRFIGISLLQAENEANRNFFREIRSSISLPYILTDTMGRPFIWNDIGMDDIGDIEWQRCVDFNPLQPNDEILLDVYNKAMEFDRINDPIIVEGKEFRLVVHHGPSKLTRELQYAPYIQFVVILIFILLGFFGFRTVKTGEQRSIWVGMAKETAHQLGTPLSSVMGWLEIIKDQAEKSGCDGRISSAAQEATADVDRLSKISSRFGKIGSMPDLEYQKLAPIIEETVEYFERRRPALKIDSTISVEMDELPLIRCSHDLVGWVFENLIKNSLDAMVGQEGKINIAARMNKDENRVEVTFSDNGRGMSSSLKKRIFSPGITTKKRGWGLGLALVKRIVEDIHDGTINVIYTHPGKGTVFMITFPVS